MIRIQAAIKPCPNCVWQSKLLESKQICRKPTSMCSAITISQEETTRLKYYTALKEWQQALLLLWDVTAASEDI